MQEPPQLGKYKREEHSRLREQQKQTLLSRSVPDTLPRKPGGQHGCQIAQGKGNMEESEERELPKQADPYLHQLQLCDHDNSLSFIFLTCKRLFTLQGVRRTDGSRQELT